MTDNIERTNENTSRNRTQRDDNNKNQRAIISSDVKNRREQAIIEPHVDGDPTRSDE